MKGPLRPFWIVYLFFATIGRRLFLALVGVAPMEARDVNGDLHLLVVKRPAEGQERADFERVWRYLRETGQMPGTPWFRVGVALGLCSLMLVLMFASLRISGLRVALLTSLPMSMVVASAVYTVVWRRTHLYAPDHAVKAAWLRHGNCPHCAYRLPVESGGQVRCSECGVVWKDHSAR